MEKYNDIIVEKIYKIQKMLGIYIDFSLCVYLNQ